MWQRDGGTLGRSSEPRRFELIFKAAYTQDHAASHSIFSRLFFLPRASKTQSCSPSGLWGSPGLFPFLNKSKWNLQQMKTAAPLTGGGRAAVFQWNRANAKVTFCLSPCNSALTDIWILGGGFGGRLGWQSPAEGATKVHGQQNPQYIRGVPAVA